MALPFESNFKNVFMVSPFRISPFQSIYNLSPIVAPDSVTTAFNTAATIAVLANDTDPDGDTLSISSVTNGTNGTVLISGTNAVYTPNAGFVGSDSFTYMASDGKGGTATGTVSVTVNPYTINFAALSSLPAEYTFARASSAVYANTSGVITSASTNVARFDTNPQTLAARGLLIEISRTNLQVQSEAFDDASWLKSGTGTTVTANTTTAPDGASTADTYTEGSTSSLLVSNTSATVTSGGTYTISCFFKKITSNVDWVRVSAGDSSAMTNAVHMYFNINTGTAGTSSVDGTGWTYVANSAKVEVWPNGWYRCSFSVVTGATTLRMRVHTATADTNSSRPDIGSGFGIGTGFYLWGAQMEAGGYASSYIKTTAASVTRAIDNATIASLSSIGFNSSEGTIYIEFEPNSLSSGNEVPISILNGSSALNAILFVRESGGGGSAFINTTSGTGGRISGTGSYASARKVAIGYKNLDSCLSVNGTNYTNSTYNMPVGLTTLCIGNQVGSITRPVNGWIKVFKYWPTRLSNSELQALTT